MENNVNFDKDLKVAYLSNLADKDCREEFMRFYPSIEGYLEELVNGNSNLETLDRVRNIISYRTKILGKSI